MRAQVTLLLAATLVAAPLAGAIGLGIDTSTPDPAEPVPMSGHGVDHAPIRVHGDEQFLLPSSGVTGGSGSADDPYVISGWTVRPEYVMWDFAGNDVEDDELVAENCKPSPIAQWEVLGAKARLHGIEIVDTTAHVRIENVTVVPREPVRGPADRFRWDSSASIGILLRNADHVTIRNVTVGEADGERLYRGICARNSDDLTIQDSTVQHTINDGLEIHDGDGVRVESSRILDSSGASASTHGIDAVDLTDLTVTGNIVRDHGGTFGILIGRTPGSHVADNTIEANGIVGVQLSQSDDAVVEANQIVDNGRDGIGVDSSAGVEIHDNNIAGNGQTGLRTFVDVDATNNWWGADSGPSGGVTDDCTGTTADGSGDVIWADGGADVCFDPWMSSSNDFAGS